MTPEELAAEAGVTWFDYQADTLATAVAMTGPQQRLCLYYKTGAGKSFTALACVRLWGHSEAVVIAPPSTHKAWVAAGQRFGVDIHCMSHAMFRQKSTVLSRHTPIIADEMHLFGGHGGKGWAKLDRLARGLQAPLVLASATPNYNDADRVYCIQHILDPFSCPGGFLQFIYAHCTTEQNPFGRMPNVLGFQRYKDAAAYLAALPGVHYLPDDLVYTIEEIVVAGSVPAELETYGLDRRSRRIMASIIEERHKRINLNLIDDTGRIRSHVMAEIDKILRASHGPVLVFANHSTVAEALCLSLNDRRWKHDLVTGKTTKVIKERVIHEFNSGLLEVLVGTASLATGTDGMDKVCDTLIILDDTDDDSLRRQLIGRIMPRGEGGDASTKQVYRISIP